MMNAALQEDTGRLVIQINHDKTKSNRANAFHIKRDSDRKR